MSQGIGSVTPESTPGEVSTPDQRLRHEIERAVFVWRPAGCALLAVLDIHQPAPHPLHHDRSACAECGDETAGAPSLWPCPTVRTIAEQLGVEL